MARLVVLADKANGYCFATLRGHTPYPPEVLYSSAADKDIWASLQVGGRTAHVVHAFFVRHYSRPAGRLRGWDRVPWGQRHVGKRPHGVRGFVR